MKKVTVCLMNDSFPPIIDGVANAVVNYAENIEHDWGHAIVATPAYPGADDSGLSFPVLRYPSIDVRKITSGYMAGIPFSPETSAYLMNQRIDVLHSHCPMTSALLARFLRKRIDAPMILTYHTKYDIDIANVVKGKALQASGIQSVVTNSNAFDEVWAVSKGAGENLKSLGYQGDYIVMPNGVDFPREQADPLAVIKVTASYDLPENVPVYLYVGRLMWYKGFHIIIDALDRMNREGRDFRMVIVGDGGDAIEIRREIQEKGLSGKVFFTGAIADRNVLKAWYTRADLFLFPSTFDSNGLVVREAAACNLASVLIKDSCAAEGVTDDRNAFLIDENAQALAGFLMDKAVDMEHLRQVGQGAGKELYLSWTDAVANAVERYHIAIELYKSGAYKDHLPKGESLMSAPGELMITVSKIVNALNKGKLSAQGYKDTLEAVNKKTSSDGNTTGRKSPGTTKPKKNTVKKKTVKRTHAKGSPSWKRAVQSAENIKK